MGVAPSLSTAFPAHRFLGLHGFYCSVCTSAGLPLHPTPAHSPWRARAPTPALKGAGEELLQPSRLKMRKLRRGDVR